MKKNYFFLILLAASFFSCNPFGEPETLSDDFGQTTLTNTWDFNSSGDYTFDNNFIEVSSGQAKLKAVDLEHSGTDFNNGNYYGTSLSASKITMQSDASYSQTHVNTILDTRSSNLIGYWRMDGNWDDISPTGNTNTNSGVSFNADAKVGSNSGQLSIGSSHVTMANYLPVSSSFTISFWFKHGSYLATGGAGDILYQGTADGSYRPLQIRLYGTGNANSNKIGSFTKDTAGNIRDSLLPVLDLNKWYHLTFVFDSTAASNHRKIYINGALFFQTNSSALTNFTATADATTEFRIGGPVSSIDARLDDLAIWNTPLTPKEIETLYKWQKTDHVGAYYSPIINTGNNSSSWNNLSWLSELPFSKELPGGPTSESSTEYVSLYGSNGNLGDDDLSLDLVSLWHLNEPAINQVNGGTNDVADSSVNGFFGDEVGSPLFNQEGILGSAIKFDGNDDYISLAPSSSLLPGDTSFTISVWVKVLALNNSADVNRGARFITIYQSNGTAHSSKVALGLYGNGTDTLFVFFAGTSGLNLRKTSAGMLDDKWHHVATTYNSTTNLLTLFLDGRDIGSVDAGTINNAGTAVARLSSFSNEAGDNGGKLNGYLDEVAIWSRDLSSQEIKQLYRRGANRVKFQVRSCDDSLCDGESWLGPANASNKDYFSELNNCTLYLANGDCDYEGGGFIRTTSPDLTLADFSGITVGNNRYFQYRALLESDDQAGSPFKPTFSSVKIGPTGKYYGGSPSVIRNQGLSFSKWKGIEESKTGSCPITYQASLDKVTWYYFDGSVWAIAVGSSDSNSAIVMNANAQTFGSSVGTGTLYLKAFLNSDTSQDCQLDKLIISVESSL